MCTVLLPPAVSPVAVDIYINNIKNINVDKNSSRGSRVVSCGRTDREGDRDRRTQTKKDTDRQTDRQTDRGRDKETDREIDMTQLLVALLNFAKAPKN
jgi:hypothetical protein